MPRFKSATEFAVTEIKKWIVAGELRPNQKIDQVETADRLELSRHPVRQALERLAEQGFVRLLPNRGAVVAPLSRSDMEDLYDTRARLEAWAMVGSWPHYDRPLIARLVEILKESETAAARNDLDGYMTLNREFHFILFTPGANRYLKRVIALLYDVSERYQRTALVSQERLQASIQNHRDMISMIQAKDLPGLLAAAEDHNAGTCAALLDHPEQFEDLSERAPRATTDTISLAGLP